MNEATTGWYLSVKSVGDNNHLNFEINQIIIAFLFVDFKKYIITLE